MEGVAPQQAHWAPPGKANPISACYAHVVLGEDFVINTVLKGGAPMAATSWAGKTGLSEMPPMGPGDWFQWGRKVKCDIALLRKYAQAVYANSDAYIASLKEQDLERKVNSPIGQQTVMWLLCNGAIGHIHEFTGEISCLKG